MSLATRVLAVLVLSLALSSALSHGSSAATGNSSQCTTPTDPNYVLVYHGQYFDWYAYASTWTQYSAYYQSQLNYPDQVYQELVSLLGVDVIQNTPDHRLYILVNQLTGGGFATGCIAQIGKGPGIGIAYDAWYSVYSGSDYWSTELIAHESSNLFTGLVVSGWPRDWWADDKSPFPYAMKILVEQALGHDDAATASLNSADPLTKMFLGFRTTYGSGIYSTMMQAITGDAWVSWFGPNPSRLLSEYVAAYLSQATGTNLASQINTGYQQENAFFGTQVMNYTLDPDAVNRMESYRSYLQQFPRNDLAWQSFRTGLYPASESVTTDKTTYAQGDTIQFSGLGFAIDGPVQACLTTDNANSYVCVGIPNAGSDGSVVGAMFVGTNIPPGPQKFFAKDVASQGLSNSVQLEILTGSGIQTSTLQVQLISPTPGPTGTFLLSGCTTGTLASNGQVMAFPDATSSATCVISSPAPTSSSQYVFAAESPSQSFLSCASGTCPLETFTVYYQYAVSASYNVHDGGSPLAPILSGIQAGSTFTTSLTEGQSEYWLDAGSQYSVPQLLGSSSSAERWIGSVNPGTTTSSTTIFATYYHQYLIMAGYSLVGGASPEGPTLFGVQFGQQLQQPFTEQPAGYWLDAGTPWSVSPSLGGNTAAERWETEMATAGEASPSTSVFPYYFHQFEFALSYNVSGGGNPLPPSFTGTQFGQGFDVPLSSSLNLFWVDSNSLWQVQNPLSGGTNGERWVTISPTSGIVQGLASTSLEYDHEFYLSVSTSPYTGGSVNPGDSWHEAGSTFEVTAAANVGWKFEGWTGLGDGSSSEKSNVTSLVFDGPIQEVATFYPALMVSVQSGGSVEYQTSSNSANGVIPGGTASSLYFPLGTRVNLVESPSSFLYESGGWTGGNSTSLPSAEVTMNGPTNVQAQFGYNFLNIEILVGIAVAAAAGVSVMVIRTRHSLVKG